MESRPIIIFGNIGSDAGYWYLGADGKLHHVPGWNPDTRQAFEAIEKNLAILQRAGTTQTAGGLNEKVQGSEEKFGM